MIHRWVQLLVLIGVTCSAIAIDTTISSRTATAGSPSPIQQILDAVTSIQGSLNALETGAISDLQSQIAALQSALTTLQNRVTTLQTQLVAPRLSSVRVSPVVPVGPDENAGCTVINVSAVTLRIRTELLSFDGTVVNLPGSAPNPAVAEHDIEAGRSLNAVGLNDHGGSFQVPVHCRFTVLTSGHTRADIRGQVEHVQRQIVGPAE
jgi:hypothetical protein